MFPEEVVPPYDINGKCEGGGALATSQANCQSVGDAVTAKSLAFGDQPGVTNRRRLAVPSQLAVGTSI
jgi:hypothetical protein